MEYVVIAHCGHRRTVWLTNDPNDTTASGTLQILRRSLCEDCRNACCWKLIQQQRSKLRLHPLVDEALPRQILAEEIRLAAWQALMPAECYPHDESIQQHLRGAFHRRIDAAFWIDQRPRLYDGAWILVIMNLFASSPGGRLETKPAGGDGETEKDEKHE